MIAKWMYSIPVIDQSRSIYNLIVFRIIDSMYRAKGKIR